MHLPPEVERLVPGLISRVAEPGAIDAAQEAERIEGLLLGGDPQRWLDYLVERGALLVSRADAPDAPDSEAIAILAGILRDQLALIQATIDLGPGDLGLLDELQRLESSALRGPGSQSR